MFFADFDFFCSFNFALILYQQKWHSKCDVSLLFRLGHNKHTCTHTQATLSGTQYLQCESIEEENIAICLRISYY